MVCLYDCFCRLAAESLMNGSMACGDAKETIRSNFNGRQWTDLGWRLVRSCGWRLVEHVGLTFS